MEIGICSFSFHRLLAAGKQDIFQYIKDCKELGCTQLDPWNAHLAQVREGDAILEAGSNPDASHNLLSAGDEAYIEQVRAAADEAGLPFGCIAVDGAHIYEAEAGTRDANRQRAYRWLDVAEKLGARQVRIDAGGPEEMPDDVFKVIVEGYTDIIDRAAEKNIQVLTENHWGPTRIPDNVVKLLDALPKLGLLLDSMNWAPGKQAEGWLKCAPRANATHIKTIYFTEDGEELTQNIPAFVKLAASHGYAGPWGVESVPREIDEIEGARRTIALIRKSLAA